MSEVEQLDDMDLIDANTEYEGIQENGDPTEGEDLTDDAEGVESDDSSDESEQAETKDSADDDDQTTEDEAEEQPLETVDDLAAAMDMPLDKVLETIKGRVTIDGQTSEVTLGELQKGYQRQVTYQKNTEALKADRSQFEQERNVASQQLVSKLQEADGVLGRVREALVGEMNTPQVQQLAQSNDPMDRLRYQELLNDHTKRVQEFQSFTDGMRSELQQAHAQMQHQNAQQLTAHLQQENQKLQQSWPEFGPTAKAEMTEFLYKEYGLSQQEVDSTTDHRLYLLARDAMKAKAIAETTEAATKRVAKLPKLQKAGKKQATAKQKRSAANARAAKAAKQSGSVEDAASWLASSGMEL